MTPARVAAGAHLRRESGHQASETFLILWLLGVDLPLATVGVVEVSSSFLRNVAVFVPAGLGVQDPSYVTFLRALEVPHALDVAAAFLLLKRIKECFWSICGYVVLALDLRAAPARRVRVCAARRLAERGDSARSRGLVGYNP